MKELNLICWGLFIVVLVLPLGVVAKTRKQTPDVDFVYFYAMGHILNNYPSDRVYDFDLQRRICADIHPLNDGQYGPIPYPPFVGILFRPFAGLSFPHAYALWLSISVLLYVAGLSIVLARFFPVEPLRRSLILCFALAFYPFIIETIVNGQLSALGFFAFALVLREEDADRPLFSGLALAVCLYKPTLLVLVIPMLFLKRRFGTLGGFALGASILLLLTTLIEGAGVWSGYLDILFSYTKASAGLHAHSILRLHKYVDLTSFSSLIPGGRSGPALIAFAAIGAAATLFLFHAGWKSGTSEHPRNRLLWAATLTWTLLVNVYVPRYDSIIVVLSLVLTAVALRALAEQSWYRWFTVIWLSIFASAWITDDVAQATRVQIVSVLFAALGLMQLLALRKLAAQQPRSMVQ